MRLKGHLRLQYYCSTGKAWKCRFELLNLRSEDSCEFGSKGLTDLPNHVQLVEVLELHDKYETVVNYKHGDRLVLVLSRLISHSNSDLYFSDDHHSPPLACVPTRPMMQSGSAAVNIGSPLESAARVRASKRRRSDGPSVVSLAIDDQLDDEPARKRRM